MIRQKFLLIALGISFLAGSTFAIAVQEEPHKPRKVKRVKRPAFEKKDWDGIYFDNLFKEGLVGQRPKPEDLKPKPQVAAAEATSESVAANSGWSSLIPNDVVENEVKRLQQTLAKDITTPVKFKSEYFEVSSVVFDVVVSVCHHSRL